MRKARCRGPSAFGCSTANVVNTWTATAVHIGIAYAVHAMCCAVLMGRLALRDDHLIKLCATRIEQIALDAPSFATLVHALLLRALCRSIRWLAALRLWLSHHQHKAQDQPMPT